MNPESVRKLKNLIENSNNNYILEKIKYIRNNNNTTNLIPEEISLLLKLINEDFENEKEKIIKEILEQDYESQKLKIFINKDNYINKRKKIILNIIKSMKICFNKRYNINNDYSLGYCRSYVSSLMGAYKTTKNYTIISYTILSLASLEESYSGKIKSLYRITNNPEELKKIREYESIEKNYKMQQIETLTKTISSLSENTKTLKYNCDKTVDNGFFGL